MAYLSLPSNASHNRSKMTAFLALDCGRTFPSASVDDGQIVPPPSLFILAEQRI